MPYRSKFAALEAGRSKIPVIFEFVHDVDPGDHPISRHGHVLGKIVQDGVGPREFRHEFGHETGAASGCAGNEEGE